MNPTKVSWSVVCFSDQLERSQLSGLGRDTWEDSLRRWHCANLDGELLNLGMAGKRAALLDCSPVLTANPHSLPLCVSKRFG